MADHQVKVRTKSQKKTPIFGLDYALSPDAVEILKRLGKHEPQSIVANQASFHKQKVNYWARRFLNQGLIKEKISSKPKIYELTAVGIAILTRSDSSFLQSCIMEDYPWKFELISDNSRIDWQKLGEPNNWVKLGTHVGNVRVEKNGSSSVIIHTGQISGFNPDSTMFEAGEIVAIVKAVLQDKGVVLGKFGFPLHDPIYKNYDLSAEVFNNFFGTLETKEEKIDHSPPDNIPHIEHKGRDAAWNFMLMGSRVKALMEKQDGLEGRLGRLEDLAIRQIEVTEKLGEKQISLQERQIEATERNTEALQELSRIAPLPLPKNDRSVV